MGDSGFLYMYGSHGGGVSDLEVMANGTSRNTSLNVGQIRQRTVVQIVITA